MQKQKDENVVKLGNVYGDFDGGNYAGNVYDKNYLCPTLNTMEGGGRQPMIIVGENMKDKIVCESRCDEGLRTFQNNTIGTVRTIDSGGR